MRGVSGSRCGVGDPLAAASLSAQRAARSVIPDSNSLVCDSPRDGRAAPLVCGVTYYWCVINSRHKPPGTAGSYVDGSVSGTSEQNGG